MKMSSDNPPYSHATVNESWEFVDNILWNPYDEPLVTKAEPPSTNEQFLQGTETRLHQKVNRMRCLLCGGRSSLLSTPTSSSDLMSEWKLSRAMSLCSALHLDPNTHQHLFAQGSYCQSCFQLILNIDYALGKVRDLNRILECDINSLSQSILNHHGSLEGLTLQFKNEEPEITPAPKTARRRKTNPKFVYMDDSFESSDDYVQDSINHSNSDENDDSDSMAGKSRKKTGIKRGINSKLI